MDKTTDSLIKEEEFNNNVVNIFNEMVSKRMVSFSEQLNKLETIE